jgi:transposase
MSNSEKPVISIPLDLPHIRVLGTEHTAEGNFILTVETTLEGTVCPKCGQFTTEFHGFDEWIQVRHLPILDRKVYIRLRPKRYRCPSCDGRPTTTQKLEWREENSPNTKAYEDYILKRLINSTVEDVSRKEEIGYDAVEGVIERRVAKQVDWTEYRSLDLLGIDEISCRKGHRDFIAIVTARLASGDVKVVGVLPDKKKQTVKQFLQSIPVSLKTTIKSVCTDLYEGFINAVKEEVPAARRVADRFHVAKAYREEVDKLRKKETKRLKKELAKAEYEKLKGAMWAFRKRSADLTEQDKEVLERVLAASPELTRAYGLREELTGIFDQELSKEEARQELGVWQERVRESGVPGFEKFSGTLTNWMEEITNYFVARESSGFVEGVNNKIKVLKRRCYGIFNLSRLYQRLFLDFEGYDRFSKSPV